MVLNIIKHTVVTSRFQESWEEVFTETLRL